MADNQTVETGASVDHFLTQVEPPTRREDARAVAAMMRRITGAEPRMWGPAIIGFGKYRYRYDSGREGEMFRVGFSPRKANLALYLTSTGDGHDELIDRLGKHKRGASCLYVNRLSDVDAGVLELLISTSWQMSHQTHGEST